MGVMLTQVSLLFLYKRVFTTHITWFRYSLYILGFLSFAVNISVFFAIILSCSPVSYGWDKTINGRCFEVRPVYVVHTVLIFVLDLSIVVAPMPIVWGLQTSAGIKWIVTGMFLLGGLSVLIRNSKTSGIPLTGVPRQCLHNQLDKTSLPCQDSRKRPPMYGFPVFRRNSD